MKAAAAGTLLQRHTAELVQDRRKAVSGLPRETQPLLTVTFYATCSPWGSQKVLLGQPPLSGPGGDPPELAGAGAMMELLGWPWLVGCWGRGGRKQGQNKRCCRRTGGLL